MATSAATPDVEAPALNPMSEGSLTDRTLAGAGWRFGGLLFKYVLRLAVIVVLARLLPPHDFGLVGAAMVFVGLTTTLMQGGFSAGLVRLDDLSDGDVRTGFGLSLMQGLAFGAVLFFGAPVGARMFAMPDLEPLLRLSALTPVFAGVGAVAEALLQRRMAFRELFGADIRSFAVGYGVVGISLAVLGWGVWALAWGAVAQQMFRSLELNARVRHAWLPSYSPAAFRRLFSFGAAELSVNVAGYGAANADYAVVARLLGEEALGYYSRAYQLMSVPLNQFSRTIASVLFASFASIQNEPERLRLAFAGCLAFAAITAFPMLSILAVVAPEAIRGVLGPVWEPAIAPLRALCFGGVLLSIFAMGDALARAQGVTVHRAARDVVYFAAIVAASWAGSRWGIDGVAAGVALACAVPYGWTAVLVKRALAMTWSSFFLAQIPGVVLAFLAGAICSGLAAGMRHFEMPDLAVLAVSATLSGGAIAGLVIVLPDRALGTAAAWATVRVRARLNATILRGVLRR